VINRRFCTDSLCSCILLVCMRNAKVRKSISLIFVTMNSSITSCLKGLSNRFLLIYTLRLSPPFLELLLLVLLITLCWWLWLWFLLSWLLLPHVPYDTQRVWDSNTFIIIIIITSTTTTTLLLSQLTISSVHRTLECGPLPFDPLENKRPSVVYMLPPSYICILWW